LLKPLRFLPKFADGVELAVVLRDQWLLLIAAIETHCRRVATADDDREASPGVG
jgi:hypothetical protein